MMKRSLWIGLMVMCSALGCASARVVHDTRDGGTVALRGPRDSARDKAEVLMRDKCPSGYSIVEQGEVAYGVESRHSNQTQARPGFFGPMVTTHGSSQQQNLTEWQIVFECVQEQASTRRYVVTF